MEKRFVPNEGTLAQLNLELDGLRVGVIDRVVWIQKFTFIWDLGEKRVDGILVKNNLLYVDITK